MDPADFKAFFLSLSDEQQLELAHRAGTTVGNIRAHWMHARKVPRKMDALYAACLHLGARFSKEQLVVFFYARSGAAAA
jgi:hypothetical protein